jgi:tetratricopeptide (TPR) repeat protein
MDENEAEQDAMKRRVAAGWLSLVLVAAPAIAEEWLEVGSDHFVIYSDQKEKVVKGFAERLERFHGAMGHMFGKPQSKPGPSNRVTVYVVSSAAKVRRVVGTGNRYLNGIYIPRAGGSVALIPRLRSASSFELTGETVLYHEYAHHFMTTNLTYRPYPRWFTEGFAEFFANVMFRDDGSVVVGTAANYRAGELIDAQHVPIRKFLSFDGGVLDSNAFYTAFYGRSWVLFHYLLMDPERGGQWTRYVSLLTEGREALDAAEGAFGDLDKLEKDMGRYMRRGTLNARVVPATALTIGPIAVRKLRPGEAEMMPTTIESNVGVSREEALDLLPQARKVAGRHPDDPAVLTALAEAEFDAGNDDAAIAAADAALAIDPQQVNAHIQKGYALAHKVESGALPKEAWKDVRKQFVRANGVEHDHPVPLVQFYLTYVMQGERPTKNAIDGLEWAMQLAPFDASLRWLVAQEMVADERYKEAALTLGPLAYSPHPGKNTEEALKLLKDVEAMLASSKDSAPESPPSQ